MPSSGFQAMPSAKEGIVVLSTEAKPCHVINRWHAHDRSHTTMIRPLAGAPDTGYLLQWR